MIYMNVNIKADIPDRWVNDFCSLLKYMEYCGKVGHSTLVGFYTDGDGDFRPKFEIECEDDNGEEYTPVLVKGYVPEDYVKVERFFDAG